MMSEIKETSRPTFKVSTVPVIKDGAILTSALYSPFVLLVTSLLNKT